MTMLRRAAAICVLLATAGDALGAGLPEQPSNLLENGAFEHGAASGSSTDSPAGWTGYFPSGKAQRQWSASGRAGKGLYLKGNVQGYHGGWFQSVALMPSATYRFSTWVKTRDSAGVEVKVLYAAAFVSHKGRKKWYSAIAPFLVKRESHDWLYIEKVFRTPAWGGPQRVCFYPALLYGQGEVWIDDAALTLVPEPEE